MTTNIIKKSFHSDVCQRIIDDVQFGRLNLFYFLGKTSKWNDLDTIPVGTQNTFALDIDTRMEMVSYKKLLPSDISYVIQRYDWVSGTVYTQYDSTLPMESEDFYVMTDEYKVYKCLDNNLGVVSTVKPTGNLSTVFRTADGYLWKYLYTVQPYKRNKFLNSTKIPVQRALSDRFYSNGTANTVSIISPGADYIGDEPLTVLSFISAPGTVGTPCAATPVIDSNGSIIKVIITDPGSGYTAAPSVTVTGFGVGKYGDNTTAKLKAFIDNGQVVNITIEDPGIDYPITASTYAVVSGDGSGAKFIPVIVNGQLVDIIIENPGSGYTFIDVDIIGSGTGAVVKVFLDDVDIQSDQSIIEQTAGSGQIFNIVVTEQGTDYPPETTITLVGDGTGATCTPVIVDGKITKITMTNFGSDYTYADVVISTDNIQSNPNATNAAAYTIIAPINGHGYDCVSELFADSICLYSNIRYSESSRALIQDYRQYGIIKNIRTYDTYSLVTNDFGLMTYTVALNNIIDTVRDEILTIGVHKYRVIDIIVSSSEIVLCPLTTRAISVGDILHAPTDENRYYTVTSVVETPDANKFSGNILYVSNSDPFTFSSEQEITLKTYIKL